MKVPQKMPLFLYYIRRKSLTERKMGDILLKVNPSILLGIGKEGENIETVDKRKVWSASHYRFGEI